MMEKIKSIKKRYIIYLCILGIAEIGLFFAFANKEGTNEEQNENIYNNIDSQKYGKPKGMYEDELEKETDNDCSKKQRIEELKNSVYYGVNTKDMYSEYSDYYVKNGEKVEDDYFEDAAFVGDLRMVSFEKKSEIVHGDFYTDVNMSVKTFNEKRIADSFNSSYKKVYIQLGYNDIANMSIEDFKIEYGKVLKNIKMRCPSARIYAQSIIYVDYDQSSCNTIHCNKNIDAYNNAILACIKENSEEYGDIVYQDVNSLVCDDNGALQDRLSDDGINLNDFCAKAIYIYLKTYV